MLALVKGTESVTVGKEYMVAMRHVFNMHTEILGRMNS